MNKFIMVVEQFATVLKLFRCFLPNAHCSHDSSLHYWLCTYCHINNKETLTASDEQMLDADENFETICHSLSTFPRNLGVLLAYDNDCCENKNFKCAGTGRGLGVQKGPKWGDVISEQPLNKKT